jgi:hypothetical protein
MKKNKEQKRGFIIFVNVLRVIISLLIMIAPSVYFSLKGQTTQMGYFIIVSAICILIINFDVLSKKLESIRLKDFDIKFNKAIDEAYATIEQLNKTKYELTGITVEIIRGHNKYGGCGIQSEYQMIESLYELNKEDANTVNTVIKTGFKQLIRHAYIRINTGISNSEDRKKIDDVLGKCPIDVDVSFSIPSKKAIVKEIENLNIDKESKEILSTSISLYDKIVCKYQSIYNDLSFVDNIKV